MKSLCLIYLPVAAATIAFTFSAFALNGISQPCPRINPTDPISIMSFVLWHFIHLLKGYGGFYPV
jgi:hypothetical protein